MTVSPFDSTLYGPLLSDRETAALFSDEAELKAMLRVEAALARVEGRLGVIPADAAGRIAEVAETLLLDPAALAAGTQSAGVPVPALVSALREAVGGEAAGFVHWGATSQDIVDTALVLRLREALGHLEARLGAVIAGLAEAADAHRAAIMPARTRSQHATPTTLGLRIAHWLAPLIRDRQRLAEFKPRLLQLQFGGASGTLAALGDHGIAVMEALAGELGLAAPAAPWHAERDGLGECAGWFALVTGSLGKIGADLVLLGQSEVGEVKAGAAGGSSTMPQKANPVGAETLVALARLNAGLLAAMQHGLIHEHERDGAAWSLEWLTLPQMVVAAGASLRLANALAASIEAEPERMRANLDASNGLILAEAAAFALARHMGREEAQALVKAACREAITNDRHLMDVLAEKTDAPLDWSALKDPRNALGVADGLIDRIIRLTE